MSDSIKIDSFKLTLSCPHNTEKSITYYGKENIILSVKNLENDNEISLVFSRNILETFLRMIE